MRWLRVAVCVVVCAAVTAWADPEADAGSPWPSRLRLSQYSRRTWTKRVGLPEASVLGVTSMADGTVVVATEAGVSRFDGLHFMPLPWNREVDGRVGQALAASQSTLFVATERALVRFDSHTSTQVPIPDVCGGGTRVAISSDGVPWIACFRSGVMRLTNAALESVAVPSVTRDLLGTAGGVMWFATDDGLYQLSKGALRHWTQDDGLPGSVVSALAKRREGGVWVATSRGLGYVDEQGRANRDERLAGRAIGPLIERSDGSLWGGLRPGGLFRLQGTLLEEQLTEVEPAWANVSALSEDLEGSLWISSATNGLTRIREGDVRAFGLDEGLTSSLTWSVTIDHQGDMWFGTDSAGVWREHAGRLTHFGADAGLGALRVLAVTVDAAGVVWVGTQQGGLFHFDGERFVRHLLDLEHPDTTVSAVTHDPNGRLVLGTDFGVLREEVGGHFVPVPAPLRIEVTDFFWASNGTLWVSSSRGLWKLGSAGLERVVPSVRSSVSRLLERPDGSFWAATDDRGVMRLTTEGSLSFCNETLRLPHDNLWSLVDDRHGHLWMSSNYGIWQVNVADLESCLVKGQTIPPPRVLGAADGMRDRECSGGYQSPAAVAPDGHVVFACIEGAMVVDAAQRSKNAVPPPVRVESVQVDGEPVALDVGPELEVGRGRITFQFAVFSYRNPEAVRARYRLEGYEEKWEESPADRMAEYTNLPPGHYRFHVIAANEDGVWNEAGATAAIEVPPTLVERVPFRVAVVLLVGALIFFWFRSRESNLKAREALVASLVGQRTAELERAKNAAEQATRARTEFLANISHEIRTPLNAVIGATDLIRQTPLTFEQREYLDIINSSGEGLLSLLNDVLDLSKIEAGHMKVSAGPVDVRLVCQRVLDSLSASVRTKQLRLEFDCASAVPPWVLSDETRLRQVMLNLVGNALKFTSKGYVRVTVSAPAVDRLRFEVEDSGIGLSAEQRGRLFQAFSQADASTSRRYGGTGLGLVISERLVNLMGGSIGVESVVGQGSRFWFEVAAPEAAAPAEVALEASLALPSLHVLLVDDSPINLRVTSDLLRRLGMNVTAANSGPEALAFASAQKFHLVLMDLQMPDMDGLETTRLLNERVKPPPPIVALTANAIEEDRRRCLQLGMRDYLTKPVRLDALMRVIRLAAEAQSLVRPPALR